MCRFKSGIILKTRAVIADGENDSHSDLLKKLGIEDTAQNAMTKFVRMELIPPNIEWWTDPHEWKPNVDQDILPEWYTEDKEKYTQMFIEVVCDWCSVHVLVDKNIDELSSGYYRLKHCDVKRLLNDVSVMCDNSTVREMYDSSTISKMYDNSTISKMYGSSTVSVMSDSSTISKMYGSSTVSVMSDSSTISKMYDNSTVREMYDSSTISKMYDNSTVREMCDSSIARDYQNKKIYVSDETELEIVRKTNEQEQSK